MNTSRLWAGSGFGLGLGAFFGSFLPLSLLPIGVSLTQKGRGGKDLQAFGLCLIGVRSRSWARNGDVGLAARRWKQLSVRRRKGSSFARMEGPRSALSLAICISVSVWVHSIDAFGGNLRTVVDTTVSGPVRGMLVGGMDKHCPCGQHLQVPRNARLAGAVGDEEEWRRRNPRIL